MRHTPWALWAAALLAPSACSDAPSFAEDALIADVADSATEDTDAPDAPDDDAPEPPPRAELGPTLEPLRADLDAPALAALVWQGGRVVAEGATGLRALGHPETVATSDRWHLGSCTKTLAATVAALLVEDGLIAWETTTAEVFDDITVHPDLAGVTLADLLGNRGGFPTDIAPGTWSALYNDAFTPTEHRARFARQLLLAPAAASPGTFTYSNAGFMVAGAMLETRAGQSWESLARSLVFTPLGMASCGFGPPASPESRDAPWGHDAARTPIPPGPAADNPPALGPGGTAHCNLEDWATFLAEHTRGARGEDTRLLPATAYPALHAAGDGDYALGLIVAGGQPWARGVAYTHSGSNTMFFATFWIAPERDTALVAVTNSGDHRPVSAAIAALVEAWLSD